MRYQWYLFPLDSEYCDIIIRIFQGQEDTLAEFSSEFLNGKKIRMVKLILGSAMAISIPFSQIVNADDRYSMTYLSYGSYQTQLEYVAISKNSFSVISPSYFNLTSDGRLQLEEVSESYVNAMHEKNIKIVPFLSNHWNKQSGNLALERVENLAGELVDAVTKYHLDGINVDIENVSHEYRDKYTTLVRLLRQKLPKDKEVSVAVAANPYGWTLGWHGSYDYKELAKYADHLFIMAYDEHFNGGEAGPVASISFVEQSIQYALKYVPKEKIVLGVPFFGRIWSEDGSVKGIGITNRQIQSAIEKTGGSVTIDADKKSVKAQITVTDAHSIKVNGQMLKSGNYTIWYDNSDTLKYKLSLVDKYGLKGAGSWSVGQETKDVWDYYSLWLNGKYFSDTFSYFAKDDIVAVSQKGWMEGMGNQLFLPEDGLTRAQAAMILCRYLNLSGETVIQQSSDIKNHWAEKEIGLVIKYGLMRGYPDGSFQPNRAVTREEIAVILQRILQYEYRGAAYGISFSDVSEDRWSYREITALIDSGILNGYPDGTFRPEQFLSRGEMAHLLGKMLP